MRRDLLLLAIARLEADGSVMAARMLGELLNG